MTDDLLNEISELKVACIGIHELFEELKAVGMDKEDALTLLSKIIRPDRGNDGENCGDQT